MESYHSSFVASFFHPLVYHEHFLMPHLFKICFNGCITLIMWPYYNIFGNFYKYDYSGCFHFVIILNNIETNMFT